MPFPSAEEGTVLIRHFLHDPGDDGYWCKIVGMGQQNWAFIRAAEEGRAEIVFVSDLAEIFDWMFMDSVEQAEQQLRHNGFERFVEMTGWAGIIAPPGAVKGWYPHPNGRIYSSGRYWVG